MHPRADQMIDELVERIAAAGYCQRTSGPLIGGSSHTSIATVLASPDLAERAHITHPSIGELVVPGGSS